MEPSTLILSVTGIALLVFYSQLFKEHPNLIILGIVTVYWSIMSIMSTFQKVETFTIIFLGHFIAGVLKHTISKKEITEN